MVGSAKSVGVAGDSLERAVYELIVEAEREEGGYREALLEAANLLANRLEEGMSATVTFHEIRRREREARRAEDPGEEGKGVREGWGRAVAIVRSALTAAMVGMGAGIRKGQRNAARV